MKTHTPIAPKAQRGAFVLELLLALTIVTMGVLLTANMMLRGAGMPAKANSLSHQYAEAAAMAASADARSVPAGSEALTAMDSVARALPPGHAIGAGTLTIEDGARQVTVTWGDGAASPDLKLIRLDPVDRGQPHQ